MKTLNEIQERLTDPLPVDQIKTTEGVYGEYIEGWYAKKVANDIFGPLGWSAETVYNEQRGTDDYDNPIYVAKVRVTIRYKIARSKDAPVQKVVREGTGAGSGNSSDPHELAVKEAETDALKRALSSFGTPFGLSLYQGKGKGQFEIAGPDWFGPKQKAILRSKYRELNLDPETTADLFKEASEQEMSVEEAVELFESEAE